MKAHCFPWYEQVRHEAGKKAVALCGHVAAPGVPFRKDPKAELCADCRAVDDYMREAARRREKRLAREDGQL